LQRKRERREESRQEGGGVGFPPEDQKREKATKKEGNGNEEGRSVRAEGQGMKSYDAKENV